jgi:uncharacterized protein (DUF1330 family)
MTGYVIFYVEEISDAAQLKKYQQVAHPTLSAAGGAVKVAYGRQEVVEGAPLTGVVMIEFGSFEDARKWYHSDAYQEAAKLRAFAARTHAVIVEGR